eukprot:1155708-Pelagomonas_calceolata.AAC.1
MEKALNTPHSPWSRLWARWVEEKTSKQLSCVLLSNVRAASWRRKPPEKAECSPDTSVLSYRDSTPTAHATCCPSEAKCVASLRAMCPPSQPCSPGRACLLTTSMSLSWCGDAVDLDL